METGKETQIGNRGDTGDGAGDGDEVREVY